MKNSLEPSQAIQRVKVGMTGLASVILLIALASAVLSSASREPPVTTAGTAKPALPVNATGPGDNSIDAAKEPLAEIGVAPSTTLESLNTTGVQPPATAAPAPVPQPQ